MDSRRPAAPDGTTWRDELSPAVRRLAELALGQALEAVVRRGSPMAPFVVLDGPDGPVLGRFEGEAGAAVARAREHARGSDAARVAVAWDGYLTVQGVRQDAVLVEASDRGLPSVVVAHRYRETVEGTVAVGRPVVVGSREALL